MADTEKRKQALAVAATAIGIVASIFAITVAILLILNAAAFQKAEPLSHAAVQGMMSALREGDAQEETAQQLQALDTLARRTFFGSLQWQREGGLLAIIGALIAIGAFLMRAHLLHTPFNPADETPPDPADARRQRVIAGLAMASVAAAFAVTMIVAIDPTPPPHPARAPANKAPPASEQASSDPPEPKTYTPYWPAFRGPDSLGIAADTATPPIHWDVPANSNVRWRVATDMPGFGSPVVAGDLVFLTVGDADARGIVAFDTEDGTQRWQSTVPFGGHELPDVTQDTGFAAATPTTDGKHVYAVFATGDVGAFDMEGNLAWHSHLGVPQNMYGHSSSLLTHSGLLLIQFDEEAGGEIIALDTETGAFEWSAERDVQTSWASPVILRPAGKDPQVVLNAIPYTAAYRLSDGAMVWSAEIFGSGEVASSPAFDGDTLFVANEYAQLAAVRTDGSGELIWSGDANLPDVSSPVATNGILVVACAYGVITAYNTETGDTFWVHEFEDGFYGSPVVADGRVYIMNNEGVTQVFEHAKTFNLIASNSLGARSSCTPAFVGNRIYIRGADTLVCIEEPALDE